MSDDSIWDKVTAVLDNPIKIYDIIHSGGVGVICVEDDNKGRYEVYFPAMDLESDPDGEIFEYEKTDPIGKHLAYVQALALYHRHISERDNQ